MVTSPSLEISALAVILPIQGMSLLMEHLFGPGTQEAWLKGFDEDGEHDLFFVLPTNPQPSLAGPVVPYQRWNDGESIPKTVNNDEPRHAVFSEQQVSRGELQEATLIFREFSVRINHISPQLKATHFGAKEIGNCFHVGFLFENGYESGLVARHHQKLLEIVEATKEWGAGPI